MCNDSTKTTNSTASQTSTSTPNVPSWISDPAQAYASQVSSAIGGDAQQYVAPASALQTQGFSGASNLGSWQDTLNKALGYVGQATSTPTPQVTAAGYSAAPAAATSGYTAAPMGQVYGYAAPTATASGYTPATIGRAAQVAGTAGATAGAASAGQGVATTLAQLLSGNGLQTYLNPYTDSVVNSTLNNYDKTAGQDQAALDAEAGLNKGFGGSGYAIQKANLTNSQELGRASTESGLRSDAYNAATGLATTDANNLTATSNANAGLATQASITNANNETGVSTTNAQLAAARAQAQAQFDQATATGNQDAINAAQAQLAQLQTGTSTFNAGQGATAAQFGAQAGNTATLDANARTDAAAAQATAAQNQASLDAAARGDQAGAFNAGATNTASAQNQNALLQSIQNLLAGGSLTAGIGGQQASNAQGDVATQLAAGGTQRGIAADQATAQLTLLQTLQSLLGYSPGMFVGQTNTGTSTGTSTQTTSPGLIDDLQGLASAYSSLGGGANSFAKAFNHGT